jgi:hypothetical protein
MDGDWFNEQIKKKYGSQRRFAPLLVARSGRPMDQAALSRMLNGEREMTVHEAVQIAKLLRVRLALVISKALD